MEKSTEHIVKLISEPSAGNGTKPHVLRRRHRWAKEVNHPFCHKYYCKNGCGTVKDSTAMLNTVYWQNGEKRFDAGECLPLA